MVSLGHNEWTHWGLVKAYGIIDLKVSIGLGNGLLPGQCQAISWTNDDLLSIWSLGINFPVKLETNYIDFH